MFGLITSTSKVVFGLADRSCFVIYLALRYAIMSTA